MSALNTQVGGSHYKKYAIQPVEYIHKNGLGYIEGSVVKYITRWRDKNGIQDLEKAKHFIELLIEQEERSNTGCSEAVSEGNKPMCGDKSYVEPVKIEEVNNYTRRYYYKTKSELDKVEVYWLNREDVVVKTKGYDFGKDLPYLVLVNIEEKRNG